MSKVRLGSIFLVLFLFISASFHALACSSFASPGQNHFLMAKSYDWSLSHGMLVVNKRNVQKKSLIVHSTDLSLNWISKYGSLTFNQYGREMPLGGINEEGLAIEILWLSSTQYPGADGRPSINETQWVQYFLDSFSSLSEMILEADSVRPSAIFANVHYLVCDKTSACATFEFIDKKLVVHQNADMPVKVLTNSKYSDSKSTLVNYKGFGGQKDIPMTGYSSLDRFVRLAHGQKQFLGMNSVEQRREHAFNMLDSVEGVDFSRWHIVYDFENKKVFFRRLNLDRENIKEVHFNKFDFNCSQPVKTFDLDQRAVDEITNQFVDYDQALNDAIVKKSGDSHGMPQLLIRAVQQYPSSTVCLDQRLK